MINRVPLILYGAHSALILGSDSLDSNYRPLNASFADESDNKDHLEIPEEDLFKEWGELDEGAVWRTVSRLSHFQLITITIAAGCVLLGALALLLVICVICCCTRYIVLLL